MTKRKAPKLPDELKDYLTTAEAQQYADVDGFVRSLQWWKIMCGKKRIQRVEFHGRFLIHKTEVERVVKEKPKLHLIDLISKTSARSAS